MKAKTARSELFTMPESIAVHGQPASWRVDLHGGFLLGEFPALKARGALCQRCGHFTRALVRVADELVDDEAGPDPDGDGGPIDEEDLHDAGGRRGDPLVLKDRLADLERSVAGAGQRAGGFRCDAMKAVKSRVLEREPTLPQGDTSDWSWAG
jgi:hypothetical protein